MTLLRTLSSLAFVGCIVLQAPRLHAAESRYAITTEVVPENLKVGQSGQLNITILPKPPYILKNTTPFSATLTPTDHIEVKQKKYSAKDFTSDHTASKTISVPITAVKAGDGIVSTALAFFICTNDLCQRETTSVERKIVVKK